MDGALPLRVYRGDPGFSLWMRGGEGERSEFEDIARPRFFAISKMAERMNGAPSWSHCTDPPSFNARFSILSAFSYKFFPIIIDEASSRVMIVVAWNDGRDVSMVDRARINRNSVEIGRRITGGNRFVDETVRLGAADRQAKLCKRLCSDSARNRRFVQTMRSTN